MLFLALLLTSFVLLVWSQQLENGTIYINYPNLSAGCQQSLNTSVACPVGLNLLAQSGGILDSTGVSGLCVDSCFSSLLKARSTIAAACSANNDTIVYNNIAYPATFFVDQYIFTYNVSCWQDSKTGDYCDPQFLDWSNSIYPASLNETCSDCWLGVLSFQLSEPLGYDRGLASNFQQLTSSCNATAYKFTSPTPYALNATATTVPPSVTAAHPAACTGSYTLQSTDTCSSVSQQLNVSTWSLLYYNNIDIHCQNLNASVGQQLCIPPQCDTHTWQALDTCDSVAQSYGGMTVTQLISWNGNLNSLCQNSVFFTGYEVCISPPGGPLNSSSPGGSSITSFTTAAPVPTNAMNGSNRACGQWHTIIEGDTCGLVSEAYSLPLAEFYFLNPEINSQCTNLDLGVAYCVEPVGTINTYSGFTVSSGPAFTVPPETFASANTAIPSSTSWAPFTYTPSTTPLPRAKGTIPGCQTYQNYESKGLNDCSFVAFEYDVTTEELLEWNPSLSTNMSSCALQPGYSYCVQQTNATASSAFGCVPVNASSIVNGTTADCSCFTAVYGYYDAAYSCANIQSNYNITTTQLVSWNRWLSSNCSHDLYAGLDGKNMRPVCVGVNATEQARVGISSLASKANQTGSGTAIRHVLKPTG